MKINIKNNYPRVSLLIPCYNAQSFVHKAIECALSQTYHHIEIIVAPDDGDTYKQLRENFKSPQIRIISPGETSGSGPGATRNRAIDISSGDFFTILDADDIISNDYIEKLMEIALIDGAAIAHTVYTDINTNEVIRKPPVHSKYLSLSGFGQLLCSMHPLIHRSLESGFCSGFAEDVVHDGLIIAKLGGIKIADNIYYDLKVRKGSETNTGNIDAEIKIQAEYDNKINQILYHPTQLGLQSLDFKDKLDFVELFKFRAYVSNKFSHSKEVCYNTWLNGKEALLWDEYTSIKS